MRALQTLHKTLISVEFNGETHKKNPHLVCLMFSNWKSLTEMLILKIFDVEPDRDPRTGSSQQQGADEKWKILGRYWWHFPPDLYYDFFLKGGDNVKKKYEICIPLVKQNTGVKPMLCKVLMMHFSNFLYILLYLHSISLAKKQSQVQIYIYNYCPKCVTEYLSTKN